MNRPLVTTKTIKKRYASKEGVREVLQGISFSIYEGEIIGLLGVNGAGKTTLSSIIAGLHPPSSGDVVYNGTSIYSDIVAYKRMIGLCPQKPNLDNALTLEENLVFAACYHGATVKVAKTRAKELMERFNLMVYAKEQAAILSGGYKQRFLIARAIIHNPKLVILDEPTVGLDPNIRIELWEEIRALKKAKTSVILTTHYLDEAEKLSDRILIISNGKIKAEGTVDALKKEHSKNDLESLFLHLSKGDEV